MAVVLGLLLALLGVLLVSEAGVLLCVWHGIQEGTAARLRKIERSPSTRLVLQA